MPRRSTIKDAFLLNSRRSAEAARKSPPTFAARSFILHVIFYRLEGDVVQIIRILHGNRDLRRIMQEEAEQ